MATLGELPATTASPLPNLNTSYEPDFDSFLNLDQTAYPASESMKMNPSLISQPSMSVSEASAGDFGQSFSAPSHQYGDHQQQTGLPPGAVAHAMTFNDNTVGVFDAGNQGFSMNDSLLAPMKREDTTIDFGTVPSRSHSEMDIESDTPSNMPYFVSTTNAAARAQQFVDPNVLGGNDLSSMGHPTAPQAGRMYPGMHQQQAAMARAAQQQQRQQAEIIRQQQQMRQQAARQVAAPVSQPIQNRPVRNIDPVVEERISRLLQQMRSNSVSQDGSNSASTPSMLPQMSKPKKEEDEMDEDERLLASEEGKKLSSKERRQLRNKVSARAFRSRRKEYIGQLEGEVAAKTNEANELRVQNRALLDENSRLTDLTRLLLSSPHFSDFLNDLTVNGLPQQLQAPQQTPRPQPQQAVSQAPVPSTETNARMGGQEFPAQQQQSFQVGMVMVPDQRMDMYASGWNSGIDMNYNPSIFAVFEVPEGPAVDTELLSGKSSSSVSVSSNVTSSKVEVPQLDRPPVFDASTPEVAKGTVSDSTIEIDESDPSFALFLDDAPVSSPALSDIRFDGIKLEKAPRYTLVVDGEESSDVSATSVRAFELLCASMDDAFERVSLLTAHLLSWSDSVDRSSYRRRRTPLKDTPSALPGVHVIPTPRLPTDSTSPDYYIVEPKERIRLAPETEFGKPMKYFYQVLSTPTADTPGSTFILCYPNRKYLFGHVAEGTQRIFSERAQSHSSLSEFFVTGKTGWNNIGGVLGMVLTMADSRSSSVISQAIEREEKRTRRLQNRMANNLPVEPEPEEDLPAALEKLTIHGGKNINHALATARRFIFRKSLPVQVREYEAESLARAQDETGQKDAFELPTWSDENIKVWAIPLKSSHAMRSIKSSVPGFRSPRKRSLNEFEEHEDQQISSLDPGVKDDMLREGIVKDMFDSHWTLDSLIEEKLESVKMPATIFIRNPTTKDLERYNGPLPGGDEPVPDIKVFVRKPWPAALVERLPATTPATESLCYIVRGHNQRGKFDPEKAKELGVPKGRAFSQLASGINYTTEDGKIITPEMVLGPSRPGKGVAFIDIPSSEFIEDFISRAEWQSPAVMSGLSVCIWILGPGVGEDPRIHDFVARMKHCEHIVSSTDHCPNYLAMKSAAKSTLRLARINIDNFPVPVHDNITLPQVGTRPEDAFVNIEKKIWRASQPGLIVDMEPKFGINESEVVNTLNPLHFINRIPRAAEQRLKIIQKRLRKPYVIEKVMDMREGLPPLGEDAEVFTLGTGSSSPSKYRNVSATLLHVPGKGYYLFDCGENTLGQLKRAFKPDELRKVMQNLRVIWISHLHADHHLGTVSVIKEWYKVNYPSYQSGTALANDTMEEILQQKKLCVISENMFIQWLEEYAGVEEFGFDKLLPLSAFPYVDVKDKIQTNFVYRHCRQDGSYPEDGPICTEVRFDDKTSRISELLRGSTGLANARSVGVNHCKGAMAVTFEWEDGFKVSYSGDCRPSTRFAQMGRDSTLLIHEATFQDDMGGSAKAKKHSTAAEAIQVGRQMNARMVVLTHFSQRYAKISKIDPTSKPTAPNQVPPRPADLDVADNEDLGDEEPEAIEDDGTSFVDDTTDPPIRSKPMPICTGFDYMRVKVRDIPISQMFAPAFERLIQRLDQASVEEAELERKKREAAEAKNPKKIAKMKAKQKWNLPAEAATVPIPEKPRYSAWSASESESGWSDSESEKEDDHTRSMHP